jgi:hypothetical protein
MPAYTTVEFVFPKESNTPEFVEQFYRSLFVSGVSFEKVHAWGCSPEMPLDKIIEWNQIKLNADFELGYDQDVSEDYRQILLSGTPFSECRVFVLNTIESIDFHLIFPESEASKESIAFAQKLSESVWNIMTPIIIQTTDELGDSTLISEYKKGTPASCEYFCFVEDKSRAIPQQELNYVGLERGYLVTADSS